MQIIINTSLLKLVEDCDKYAAIVQEEINSLNLEIQVDAQHTSESAKSTVKIQDTLSDLEVEIAAGQAYVNALPVNSVNREKVGISVRKMETRMLELGNRLKEDNLFSVLDGQIELEKTRATIAILTDVLAQIAQRKTELTANS